MALIRLLPFLVPAALAAQEAPRDLLCRSKDGRAFWSMLWAPTAGGPPVHCVEAPGLEGLDACAPQGGWGLSGPDGAHLSYATGPAAVAHDGGWFFARVGPSELVASASVGTRPPLALEVAGETFWRMRLSLVTGEGAIHTRDGAVAITCGPG